MLFIYFCVNVHISRHDRYQEVKLLCWTYVLLEFDKCCQIVELICQYIFLHIMYESTYFSLPPAKLFPGLKKNCYLVLIYISLISCEIGCLSICLLLLCFSVSLHIHIFCHYVYWIQIFLCSGYSDTNPLHVKYAVNIFSQSVTFNFFVMCSTIQRFKVLV